MASEFISPLPARKILSRDLKLKKSHILWPASRHRDWGYHESLWLLSDMHGTFSESAGPASLVVFDYKVFPVIDGRVPASVDLEFHPAGLSSQETMSIVTCSSVVKVHREIHASVTVSTSIAAFQNWGIRTRSATPGFPLSGGGYSSPYVERVEKSSTRVRWPHALGSERDPRSLRIAILLRRSGYSNYKMRFSSRINESANIHDIVIPFYPPEGRKGLLPYFGLDTRSLGDVQDRDTLRSWSLHLEELFRAPKSDKYLRSSMFSGATDSLPRRIRCNWEIPRIYKSWNSTEEMKNLVVVVGSESNFEAATCAAYLSREWDDIGYELITLIIHKLLNPGRLERTKSNRIENILIDDEYIEVVCRRDIDASTRASIAEALIWLCKAVRMPCMSRVSTSTCLVENHREYAGDMIPYERGVSSLKVGEHGVGETLFAELQPLKPLTVPSADCWLQIFKEGIVSQQEVKRTWGKGLKVSFDLMLRLTCVTLPVEIDGGIVLVGYSTALVPIERSGDSLQWHLETSSNGQIDPGGLQSIQGRWYKARSFEELCTANCFLGWCEKANIFLGTSAIGHDPSWSDGRVTKSTWRFTGINPSITISHPPVPITAGASANFTNFPNTLQFNPENEYQQMIRNGSKRIVIVHSKSDERAWMVHQLSLLLHMSHLYVEYHSISPDPIPFAQPGSDGGKEAFNALTGKGDTLVDGAEGRYLNLGQLLIGLNINLMESRKRFERPARSQIYSYELMDMVTQPPAGGNMKKIPVPNTQGWINILELVDGLATCSQLGDVIKPAPLCRSSNDACNTLPKGHNYLAASCACLSQLIDRQGSRIEDSTSCGAKFLNGRRWTMSGDPFSGCTHPTVSEENCWEAKNRTQKILRRGIFSRVRNSERAKPPSTEALQCGAVVFGHHAPSSKRKKNSWREHLPLSRAFKSP